jgi:hypothetical protein
LQRNCNASTSAFDCVKRVLLLAASAVVGATTLAVASAPAAPRSIRTIGFGDVDAGTVLRDQYASRGVRFGRASDLGAPALDSAWDCGPPTAVSGSTFDLPGNVALTPACDSTGVHQGTVTSYAGNARSVAATVGLGGSGRPGSAEIRAYNAAGQLLTSSSAVVSVGGSTRLSIVRSQFDIKYAAIQLATPGIGSVSFYFDDLSFDVAPLDLTGQSFSATVGAPVDTVVAHFSDEQQLAESAYTATIGWGDGSTSSGRVTRSGSALNVAGNHTYAQAGTFTVETAVTVSDGRAETTRSTATVGATARPDFTVSVSPATVGVKQGQSGVFTVSAAGVNGFSGTVSLALTGATGSFAPSTIPAGGSSRLTVTTSLKTVPAHYPLTITASSGGVVHTAGAALDVSRATASRPRLDASFRSAKAPSFKLAVIDAAKTVGAARLLWDLNGDGQNDLECGGASPVLGVRLYKPGTYAMRLTAIAKDGRRSVARGSLVVSGPAPPGKVLARTPPVALCGKRAVGKVHFENTCADRVVFGIVEVRGCLRRVTKREDVPPEERAVVDEYYKSLQLPRFAQVQCERGSPRCPDWITKYGAFELYVADGSVKINGVTLSARKGRHVVVFPILQRVVSSSGGMTLGFIPIKYGGIDLDLRTRYFKFFGERANEQGSLPISSFDPGSFEIGGFKVLGGNQGRADLSFESNGVRRYTLVKLRLALPAIFSSFGSRPPSGESSFTADNNSGLDIDHVHLAVPEANLGGIRFSNVTFDYSASGNAASNCSRAWWKATANVFLGGGTGRDAGFLLSPPPSQNGIAFCAGRFRSAGGAIVFGAQIPPPELFPGLFLDEINFAVGLDPTLVRGGGELSAAEVTSVKGTLLTVFPSPGAPYVLTDEDAGRELAPLRGRVFVTPTLAMGGAFSFRIPLLGNVPFGNAYFLYSYPDYIALGGGMRLGSPGLLVYGTIDGELDVSRALFNFHGSIGAEIAGLPRLGVDAWVTSTGVVVCGSVLGLHPGAGYRWGAHWPDIWLIDGCAPSPYWVNVRRGALAFQDSPFAAPITFTVARGEGAKNVRVPGIGGAPAIEVRGPDGETVSTATNDFAKGRTIAVLRQPAGKVTWVGVQNGKPGRYTVTMLPGSPRIADVEATRPHDSTPIDATVGGSGATRVLHYRANVSSRERVAFFEVGPTTYRLLGTVRAGRGRIVFTPSPGGGGTRHIVARVELDGMPAPDATVARFRVSTPRPPASPRFVHVHRRRSSILVSWSSVRGAQDYGVTVTLGNGILRPALVPGTKHTLVVRVSATQKGTVGVRAFDALRRPGAERSATFRAATLVRSRFLPFRTLGK